MTTEEIIKKTIEKIELEANTTFIPQYQSQTHYVEGDYGRTSNYRYSTSNATEVRYAEGYRDGLRKAVDMLKDNLEILKDFKRG